MTSLPLAPRWRLRESAANRHLACGATDGQSAWQRVLDARQTHRVALIVVRAAGGHVVFHITGAPKVVL